MTSKGLTKTELCSMLAAKTELKAADIKRVFEALYDIVSDELKKNRPVTIPDLIKIKIHVKEATPARKGRNPATGAEITIAAKPKRRMVKVKPIKALKELA
jgi:nucleoid DNA-binding protein